MRVTPGDPGLGPGAGEGHGGAREERGGEVITDRCHVVLIIPALHRCRGILITPVHNATFIMAPLGGGWGGGRGKEERARAGEIVKL